MNPRASGRCTARGHPPQPSYCRLPKYLTQDELHRFFAVIPSPRDRALFAVIYHYGLRVDEATMLALEDVDLLAGQAAAAVLRDVSPGRPPRGVDG